MMTLNIKPPSKILGRRKNIPNPPGYRENKTDDGHWREGRGHIWLGYNPIKKKRFKKSA